MASTFIMRNEKVEDYFVQLDEFEDIRQYYERGKLIIFDRVPFLEKYKDFLKQQVVTFATQAINVKKIKGDVLTSNITKDHILHKFTNEPFKLQEIILDIYTEIKRLFFKLFPGYTIHSENWSWRLTITKDDAMHLDSYAGQDNDLHNVRIFVNLDSTPRVWRTTHVLPKIYKQHWALLKELPKNVHPNAINELMNSRVGWKALPFHEIHFKPFSIWLCDSQFIPHQGVRGTKLAAYTFRVFPETMLHPELSFEKQGRYAAWNALNQE